jgi:hypothetical protein
MDICLLLIKVGIFLFASFLSFYTDYDGKRPTRG